MGQLTCLIFLEIKLIKTIILDSFLEKNGSSISYFCLLCSSVKPISLQFFWNQFFKKMEVSHFFSIKSFKKILVKLSLNNYENIHQIICLNNSLKKNSAYALQHQLAFNF